MTRRISRDRRSIELIGLRRARLFGSRARRFALAALRIGASPAAAVRAVIRGSDELDQPGLVPVMVDCMVAASLKGSIRSLLHAREATGIDPRQASPVELATGYEGAIDFLMRRLGLSDFQLAELRDRFEARAIRVTDQISVELERAVQQAVLEATQEGAGVREGIAKLRDAFEAEGFVPGADYQLENIFRTQTQLAYGAGRFRALQNPAIQRLLWGFEYVTVGDERVRPTHAALDGLRRPKDDPVWRRIFPPNGYNCRCDALEIYHDEPVAEATELPSVTEADPGFNFNPGEILAAMSDL